MPLLTLFLAAGAHAQAPAKPPSTEDAQVAHVADAKWAPPKAPEIPAGAMASIIAVDPNSGASIAYAKFPPGYAFPPHWHSFAEYTVLISGKANFVIDGKSHQMVAGSYLVVPAKTQHQVTCGTGSECLLLTRRAGPTDYHFVAKK
ncbi:MAG TPA: cupin domain-containing protein [Myxococcaceae bacterium]|nr:cupin domain-containing protein [Myxococcaceae bacterium]